MNSNLLNKASTNTKITIAVAVFGIIVSIILFFMIDPDRDNHALRILNAELRSEYSGVITKKYLDSVEHLNTTIIIDDVKKITLPKRIYEKLKLNDSISKNKNLKEINIWRENKKLNVTYSIDDFR